LPSRALAAVVLKGETVAVLLLAVPGTRMGYGVAVTLLVTFCGENLLAITSQEALRCRCFRVDGGAGAQAPSAATDR
jgi:hypothetical protein